MEPEIVFLFLDLCLVLLFVFRDKISPCSPGICYNAVCVFFKALVKWIDDESCGDSGTTPKSSSEHVHLPKPVEAFKDWRAWIIRCIAVLEK